MVSAKGSTAGLLLYAALGSVKSWSLELAQIPFSHTEGPHYLSIMRFMDLPASVLLAAKQHQLNITIDPSHTQWSEWKKLQAFSENYAPFSLEK